MKESEIQKAILDYLKSKGIFAWRAFTGPVLHAGGRIKAKNPMAGCPDICGILAPNGRMLLIEVKTDTGKVAPHQQDWIDKSNQSGALAFVARSVDDVVIALARK